jgi:small GTP-binding protein
MSSRNIVFIGDGGVGKTTLLENLKCNRFEKKYCATVGAEVHPMQFGDSIVDVWDVAGQDQYVNSREGYYENADAAMIMFDVTQSHSYRNVEKWYDAISDVRGEIPIVVVGNKCESENRKIFGCDYNLLYFEMSVKNREKMAAPLEYLATMD